MSRQVRCFWSLAATLLLAVPLAAVFAASTSKPALAATDAGEILYGNYREFAGADRYTTAGLLAANFMRNTDWSSGSRTLLLASGETLVDAITIAGLAGVLDAPVLLTEGDRLSANFHVLPVRSIAKVIILGGPSAISPHVEQLVKHRLADAGQCQGSYDDADHFYRRCDDPLGANWTPEQAERAARVVRIHGPDRHSTAAAIAREMQRHARDPSQASHLAYAAGKWCGGFGNAAVLVEGRDAALPYAMSIGPLAARSGLPILMSDGARLPQATLGALRDLEITHVAIIGGTGVVPSTIEAQLTSSGISTIDRVGGSTPEAVSAEVAKLIQGDCAEDLRTTDGGVSPNTVALVNAAALPDGVAAAPVLARSLADGDLVPLLLVGSTLPQPVDRYLQELRLSTRHHAGGSIKVAAIGGHAAVNRCVVQDALRTSAKSAAAMPELNKRFAAAAKGSVVHPANLTSEYTDEAELTVSLKWNYQVHSPSNDADASADALLAWQFRDCYAPVIPDRVRLWAAGDSSSSSHSMTLEHYFRMNHRYKLSYPISDPSRLYYRSLNDDHCYSHDTELSHYLDCEFDFSIDPFFSAENTRIIQSSINMKLDSGDVPEDAHPVFKLSLEHQTSRIRPAEAAKLSFIYSHETLSAAWTWPKRSKASGPLSADLSRFEIDFTAGNKNQIHLSLDVVLSLNGRLITLDGRHLDCDHRKWPQNCLERIREGFRGLLDLNEGDMPRYVHIQWTPMEGSDTTDWAGAESAFIRIFEDLEGRNQGDAGSLGFLRSNRDDHPDLGSKLAYNIKVKDRDAKYLVRVRLVKDPEGSEPVGDWSEPQWSVADNPHKKLSRKIEKDVVKALGKKHSWLRDAWQHMKAHDANVRSHWPDGPADARGLKRAGDSVGIAETLCRDSTHCYGPLLWIKPSCAARASCFKGTAVHELAHIYTLTSTAEDRRPATLGAAAMYFFHLADGHKSCPAHELWADALARSVVGSQYWPSYWRKCPKTARHPTREALKIVSETIDGTWPSWFRKRYGTSDPDKFNLKKIWSDLDDYRQQEYRQGDETYTYGSSKITLILAHFSEAFGEPCRIINGTYRIYSGGVWHSVSLSDEFLKTAGHPWGGDKCASS